MIQFDIPLDTPLRANGGEITALKLFEPTAIDLFHAWRTLDGGENPESILIFARTLVTKSARVPESAISVLGISKTSQLAERMMSAIQSVVDAYEHDPSLDRIELTEPVTLDGIEYTEIAVREPETGEMIRANGHMRTAQTLATQLKAHISLVSQVSGIPVTTVQKFPASVVLIAARVIEGFTDGGRQTGES